MNFSAIFQTASVKQTGLLLFIDPASRKEFKQLGKSTDARDLCIGRYTSTEKESRPLAKSLSLLSRSDKNTEGNAAVEAVEGQK